MSYNQENKAIAVKRMNEALSALPKSPVPGITYFAQGHTTDVHAAEFVAFYAERGYQTWSWPDPTMAGLAWVCVRADPNLTLPAVPTGDE